MWIFIPLPLETGVSDGYDEPSSPAHDRGHDGPQSVALNAAILHLCGREVQPSFRFEARHWPVSDLCQLFEGCGVADELMMQVLNRLYERRLIEALDPNIKKIGVGDKVAIKESGTAHIELILTSTVYIEQMALTTGVNELFARDEMRRNSHQKMDDVCETFLRYVLKIDAGRIAIPSNPVYAQMMMARKQLERLTSQGRRQTRGARASYY
jgi:hypothetical protein